ncbi:uncharacterized protein B0I36DRAFT_357227 [Microdochium trichocladiopsis]|uniref:RWD domain-containing protein n=1 Tax=Microdochium trichocladiopsis TaxID=1682393 RepID=A0A9P8YID2_9PEZI|nr:uncharacterized protein B0I36DRAFT_357227 [Microdochium trichocladiopsis]KAH7039841.1 hypothetical protein B0I36DRAFT_357227 [Microdochium trichocladiopsis]
MANEASSRLAAELEMLLAMYPDGAVAYSSSRRELRFAATTSPAASSLVLRLPETYPASGFPEILTASRSGSGSSRSSSSGHEDLRERTKAAFQHLAIPQDGGEEILDALILAFQDLVEKEGNPENHDGAENNTTTATTAITHEAAEDSPNHHSQRATAAAASSSTQKSKRQHKTVVIWLHHLLNTNKRKLALHPTLSLSRAQPSHSKLSINHNTTTTMPPTSSSSSSSSTITGLTKPGYPGILVYSGPSELVAAHVAELRAQRWQAFQVRYDSDDHEDDQDHISTAVGGGERGPGRSSGEAKSSRQGPTQRARRVQDKTARGGGHGGAGETPEPGLWAFEHDTGTIVEVESIALAARAIKHEGHRETFLAAVGVK